MELIAIAFGIFSWLASTYVLFKSVNSTKRGFDGFSDYMGVTIVGVILGWLTYLIFSISPIAALTIVVVVLVVAAVASYLYRINEGKWPWDQ